VCLGDEFGRVFGGDGLGGLNLYFDIYLIFSKTFCSAHNLRK